MKYSCRQRYLQLMFRLRGRYQLPLPAIQVLYRPELGLAYTEIPKCASSSLRRAIYRLENPEADPGRGEAMNYFGSTNARRYFSPREFARLPDYKFTVIRDPIARFLSSYDHRVVRKQDLKDQAAQLQSLQLPVEPDLNEFVQHLEAYRRINRHIRVHTNPQWIFMAPDISMYNRVYTTKQTEALQQAIQQRLPAFRLDHDNISKVKVNHTTLQPDAEAKLKHFYARDYALFGALLEA